MQQTEQWAVNINKSWKDKIWALLPYINGCAQYTSYKTLICYHFCACHSSPLSHTLETIGHFTTKYSQHSSIFNCDLFQINCFRATSMHVGNMLISLCLVVSSKLMNKKENSALRAWEKWNVKYECSRFSTSFVIFYLFVCC